MVLCFICLVKTVLRTQPFFSCCWPELAECPGFSVSCAVPPARRPRIHKQLRGDRARTPDQNGILYYETSSSSIKAGGKERGKGGGRRRNTLRVTVFVFPRKLSTRWSPAFLERNEHLPVDRTYQMNSLCCVACAYSFWFAYYPVLILAHKFSHLDPSNPLPHPAEGGVSKWLRGSQLPTGLWVNPEHLYIIITSYQL